MLDDCAGMLGRSGVHAARCMFRGWVGGGTVMRATRAELDARGRETGLGMWMDRGIGGLELEVSGAESIRDLFGRRLRGLDGYRLDVVDGLCEGITRCG